MVATVALKTNKKSVRQNTKSCFHVFACFFSSSRPRLSQGLESVDSAEFQSFDLTSYTGQYATSIGIIMQGTGSGAPGFKMLDGRVLGTQIDNPTDTFFVSARRAGAPPYVGRTGVRVVGGDVFGRSAELDRR